jgi:hypothetical protein
MSRFNELLHGSASHAAELLGDGRPVANREEELRLALCNALNRVSRLEDRTRPPAKVRGPYRVTVQKMIAFGRVHKLDENIEGEYPFCAIDEDDALDQFHLTVPVKVLEDFAITAESVK